MIRKKVVAIIGSTREASSNLRLVQKLRHLSIDKFEVTIFNRLSSLPHFNPDLDGASPPQPVIELRQQIKAADSILICTPEYVFSLPGSLKNAIEWCVSTTLFSNKPVGLITASASGEKAQEELERVMKTLEAKFTRETSLLIKGIKGKFDSDGNSIDEATVKKLVNFIAALDSLLRE